MKVLVVTNPFAGREAGHVISDPAVMEEVLAGEHAGHVVAAEHEDDPHDAVAEPHHEE